jgi:hypothetical protein
MLTNQQLATMVVRNVIFHDVPNQRGEGGGLVLATDPTTIDQTQRRLLQDKLKKVLDSRTAYGIIFSPGTGSPIPASVREYTSVGYTAKRFVDTSQVFARHLHQVQHGAISPGLLCVIDITIDGQHGLVLMKLEREIGAQLELKSEQEKKVFLMAVMQNLVLTSGTRLFKTAAFLRAGTGDEDFVITACDSQHRATDSSEMARFWITFLGCTVEEEPRVTTAKFYAETVNFINTWVTDPAEKTQLYESLHSELQSKNRNVTPRSFVRDYVPDAYQGPLLQHLEEKHVSVHAFEKSNEDIKNQLRRLTYVSARGVRIVAPEGADELVRAGEETITVNDRLRSVGRS